MTLLIVYGSVALTLFAIAFLVALMVYLSGEAELEDFARYFVLGLGVAAIWPLAIVGGTGYLVFIGIRAWLRELR